MSDHSQPVLYDRNGEPIRVGDRVRYEPNGCCGVVGYDNTDRVVVSRLFITWDDGDRTASAGWFEKDMSKHYTKLKEDKVAEQLVRIGRNDLYRRGDTEIKDGRRVAKPGAEPVTVLSTTLRGPYTCAYEYQGAVQRILSDGSYWETKEENFCDLVAIDPAPKILPWEFSEIPVDHWFRRKGSAYAFPCNSVDESDETINIGGTWRSCDLLLDDYEHSPSHAGPFEPCGKVV